MQKTTNKNPWDRFLTLHGRWTYLVMGCFMLQGCNRNPGQESAKTGPGDQSQKRAGASMNRYPSFVEYQGMYNVNPEEWRDKEFNPDDFSSSFHKTVDDLPPLTWREFENIRGVTLSCLLRHGLFEKIGKNEAKAFYKFCVGDELMDRTARVELPNFRILTAELVKALQKEVLKSRPIWRIMIVSEAPQTTVMIYPEVIKFGIPTTGDLPVDLRKVVDEELNLREPREGPHRRQMEYLKQKVVQELSKLPGGEEPFQF